MSRDRIRYLLADEVGLGKTIEAGLVLRELKLRGMVERVLVVAPKGLVRQWQTEMALHFGETLHFIEPSELGAFRQWRTDEDSLWRVHNQVICSLDSVKPIEGRRGWSLEQLATYNRERFEDLVSAGWDLVIIDEAHRLGGSTDQVARYKLGAALAEATPFLLLLSATPHQGKTDQFLRLMQLIDRDTFPDEASVRRERVQPFVIRTEKRAAINADGQPLFKPRMTRLHPVAWQDRHAAQQQLYESVTEYVRHGYNQAIATKKRHIGFLMILMQRLVTSSTAAIRTTLEKRLAALEQPQPQASLFETIDAGEWAELDGQTQVDLAVDATGWAAEKAEVEALLDLARKTESQATDAKAEALLELIYRLQQEENDPSLKVLVFTEFVPTQSMLGGYLESRGFAVVTLNGGMDLDSRTKAQRDFAGDARILVSTDAGGEGLNLQFCHVIVNFDMPWNPMRVEQRIGRVDRIGQPHVVRAFNFVLQDTVEHRVRDVLETKLALIADEFGVDKAADVMDSAEAEPLFEHLFVSGIQNPDGVDQQCEAVAAELRTAIAERTKHADLISDRHDLDAGDAKKWQDHPAQFWLERAITIGLPARGGAAIKSGETWTLDWPDRSTTRNAIFDARSARERPEAEWITLEDQRARAIISRLPPWVEARAVPVARVSRLPDTITGVWSLWRIGLTAVNFKRTRFLPVFISDDGRSFVPTARRVWDLLLTESVAVSGAVTPSESSRLFTLSRQAAERLGEQPFSGLVAEFRSWVEDEMTRAKTAYDARMLAIGRVGLPAVREHRRARLNREHDRRIRDLEGASAYTPDLAPLLVLRLEGKGAGAP
jgi:superfamily II DNA or RNA helicase